MIVKFTSLIAVYQHITSSSEVAHCFACDLIIFRMLFLGSKVDAEVKPVILSVFAAIAQVHQRQGSI